MLVNALLLYNKHDKLTETLKLMYFKCVSEVYYGGCHSTFSVAPSNAQLTRYPFGECKGELKAFVIQELERLSTAASIMACLTLWQVSSSEYKDMHRILVDALAGNAPTVTADFDVVIPSIVNYRLLKSQPVAERTMIVVQMYEILKTIIYENIQEQERVYIPYPD